MLKIGGQRRTGGRIVDFYCPEHRLAIEVDGDSHFTRVAKQADERRQNSIESFGIRVLRFTNTDVAENLEGVLERIGTEIEFVNQAELCRPDPTPETPCVPPLQGGNIIEPGAHPFVSSQPGAPLAQE